MLTAAWVFGGSLAACVYVYAGYPALLLLLARLRPRRVRRAVVYPRLTVIIPAFDEEAVIERKIHDTRSNGYPPELLQVLVASDGSTDRTNEIVRRLEGPGLRLLPLPRRGKLPALNAAAAVATGEILVFTDADVVLDAGALARLVANFADPDVGGVTGRKALLTTSGSAVGQGEGLYTRFDEWQKQLESRIGSTIASHGALHALRRELFIPIVDRSAADDMAISMRVVLQGRRLVHEPEAVARVEPPLGGRTEFGRKVRIANQAMWAMWGLGAALWTSGFYSLQLISHKLLRYFVPVFLLLMLAANGALALQGRSGWRFVFMLQAGFYGAAAMGAAMGALTEGRTRRRTSRIFAVPSYFCAVNAAALAALFSLLRGRGSGTWTPGGGFHADPCAGRARCSHVTGTEVAS